MFRICIVILFLCLSSQALAKPPVFLTSQKEAQKVSEDLGFPVLTIVSATWCGPCKQLHHQISTNIDKLEDLIILTVDGDKNPDFMRANKINSYPTIIFNNKKYVGYKSIDQLLDIIHQE